MKITMIGTLPPIKGISDTCIKQIETLSKYIEVDFIGFKSLYPESLYPSGTKEKNGSFKLKMNKNIKVDNIISWRNPFSWSKAGMKPKGKTVHFHWWTYFLFPVFFSVILISKLRGKKIICEVHNILGHETNTVDKLFTKSIFMLPNHFIVHSKENKKKLKDIFNIKNNISIIPLGVPDFYLSEKISELKAREYLGLKKTDKVILSFGNIRKYKGIDVLIEAFYYVKKEIPNAKLVIAGKPWIDWKPYSDLIEKYDLEKELITSLDFIPTSKVKYFFTASDLVVLPYKKFDAQSGPGRIALLFKKPLVVSQVGALPQLVKDKRCIARSNSPKELGKCIIRILKNEKILKKLSKDSEELAEKYDWDKIAKRTVKLYEKLGWTHD